MFKEHHPQEFSYFVITDGVDAVGEIAFFSTLTEALELAGDMGAKESTVTVEICL
jgi:hypothetical protein